MWILVNRSVVLVIALSLCGCGEGENEPGGGVNSNNSGSSSDVTWEKGAFLAETIFKDFCSVPRSGTSDKNGTGMHEKMWLRSWTNNTYLWYDEVPDMDPGVFLTTTDYFAQLKTPQKTASGAYKDRFHFAMSTDEWHALSETGESLGYGVEFLLIQPKPPRKIVAAYTEPGSQAANAGIQRGDEFIEANGVDVIHSNDVDTLNAAFFPSQQNAVSSFKIRKTDGSEQTINLIAGTVTQTPVQNVKAIETPSGKVGYLQFNSHIATAERELVNAVSTLEGLGIRDLVLDIRYNGGGLLAIASQLGYMIAGPARTNNKIFERTGFNDKHTSINPVTGRPLEPMPFYNTGVGFSYAEGQPLPHLDLNRVFVLTTADTCSASEAIINGLRGVNLEVVQIGERTCGKPYGFYPTDNCGTTYFTIQFRGENDKGFGDYADGFEPLNSPTVSGEPLQGCMLTDDFTHRLGDPAESLFAAALQYRLDSSCPAPAPSALLPSRAQALPSEGLPVEEPLKNTLFKQNRILQSQ